MKQVTIEDIEALLIKTFSNGRDMREQCRSAAVDIFFNWIKPARTVSTDGAKIEDEWAIKSRELGLGMNQSLTDKWGKK